MQDTHWSEGTNALIGKKNHIYSKNSKTVTELWHGNTTTIHVSN